MAKSSKAHQNFKEEILYWNTQHQNHLPFTLKHSIVKGAYEYFERFKKIKKHKIKVAFHFSEGLKKEKLESYQADINKAVLIYLENTVKFWDHVKEISVHFEVHGITFYTNYLDGINESIIRESIDSAFLEHESQDFSEIFGEVHSFYQKDENGFSTKIHFFAAKKQKRKYLEI